MVLIQLYRAPDTPLLSFYTTGKYDKPIGFTQFKQHSALPVTKIQTCLFFNDRGIQRQ